MCAEKKGKKVGGEKKKKEKRIKNTQSPTYTHTHTYTHMLTVGYEQNDHDKI
jgi:hypothetical protein